MENIRRLIEIRQKGIEAVNIEDIPIVFQILCDFINSNPGAQKLIEGYNLRIILKIEDVKPYYLKIKEKKAEFNIGLLKSPDFIIKSNLKIISSLLLGHLDPLEAYFSELLKIEGKLLKVINFVKILDLAFEILGINNNQDRKGVYDAKSVKQLVVIYLDGPSSVKPAHVPLFLDIFSVFVNANPEAKEIISGEDISIQMKIIDLDNYIIHIADNKMEWSNEEISNPDVILETDLETSVELLINNNPITAYMEGKLIIEGEIAKALILQSLIDAFLDFIDL